MEAWGKDSDPACYDHVVETMTMVHALGVRILAGTDAPSDGTTHGASMHRELELLVEAGTDIRATRAIRRVYKHGVRSF